MLIFKRSGNYVWFLNLVRRGPRMLQTWLLSQMGVAPCGVTEIWGHISLLPPLVYVPAACQRPGLISWITEIKQRGRGAEERESAVPLQEYGMKGAQIVKWGQRKILCSCLRVRRGGFFWFLVCHKWKMCHTAKGPRAFRVDTVASLIKIVRLALRACVP